MLFNLYDKTDLVVIGLMICSVLLLWTVVGNFTNNTNSNIDNELAGLIRILLSNYQLVVFDISLPIPIIPGSISIVVTLGGIYIKKTK